MKQAILITLLFIFCIACNKDDDQNNDLQLVSGKWYFETRDGEEAGGCHKRCNVEFTSDGRLIFEAFVGAEPNCINTENYTGTYTVSGNDLTIVLGSETINGTFCISNGVLTYIGEALFTHEAYTSTYDKTPE